MGIDVRQYAMANQTFTRASCVGCGMCAQVCPRGVLKARPSWFSVRGCVRLRPAVREAPRRPCEVGGGSTFARSVRATRVGGTVSLIGVLAGNTTEVNLATILMQNIRVQGVIVGSRDHFGKIVIKIS